MTPWSFRGHGFKAEFLCKDCDNKFIGRVTFKKYYDKVVVKHNTAPVSAIPVKIDKEKLTVPENTTEK